MAFGYTLRQALAVALETALNQAMEWDPGTQQRLLPLLERPLCIQVDPPGFHLWLLSDARGLRVQWECAEDAAVTLTGTPLSLTALAFGDRTPLQHGRVTLSGDATLMAELQDILHALDPDWEGALAGVIGDVPAHLLGRRIRDTLGWVRQAHQALLANIEDYVQEETGTLPARNEAEALFEDIGELRLATDRLQARIEQLETVAAGQHNGEPES